MKSKPYNRSIHYSKSNNNLSKDFYTLRSLAPEIFPGIGKERAYRNTLSNFQEACLLLNKKPDDYRSKEKSPYRIPRHQKTAFVILIRHLTIYKAGIPFKDQDYENITKYARDLISIKDSIDNSNFENMSLNSDDYANFYEIYYSSSDIRHIITHQLSMDIIENILADFKYIVEEAPNDRTTFYADSYRSFLKANIKKISSLTKKMIDEEWHNKKGNE
ncbi:hypothetical protein D3C74_271320 [compost metagenome]